MGDSTADCGAALREADDEFGASPTYWFGLLSVAIHNRRATEQIIVRIQQYAYRRCVRGGHTAQEHADAQGVKPIEDVSVLAIDGLDDEELRDLFEADRP